MALNNNLPYRQSIRMRHYDYRQPGIYFITICTHQREPLFGEIIDERMHLNAAGRIVQSIWNTIPEHYSDVVMDKFVVMPDHFHGIIVIPECTGTACRAPTIIAGFGKPIANSIATIIRSFKSASTKSLNELRNTPGMPLWQRNYWERIIRHDNELQAIRRYIQNNPVNWQTINVKSA